MWVRILVSVGVGQIPAIPVHSGMVSVRVADADTIPIPTIPLDE
jgi:hypothetical protein